METKINLDKATFGRLMWSKILSPERKHRYIMSIIGEEHTRRKSLQSFYSWKKQQVENGIPWTSLSQDPNVWRTCWAPCQFLYLESTKGQKTTLILSLIFRQAISIKALNQVQEQQLKPTVHGVFTINNYHLTLQFENFERDNRGQFRNLKRDNFIWFRRK